MLIIRGVNIFPRQIEELIVSEAGRAQPHYRIDVRREARRDELAVTAKRVDEGIRRATRSPNG